MLRRIGVVGDVHAEDQILQAALTFLQAQGVDKVLCTGDVVDGAGDAERCCQLLREHEIDTVRGNHDRWFLNFRMRDLPDVTDWEALSFASRSWLWNLPATRSYETCLGRLLLCHGVGDNDMRRLTPDDYGYALQVNDELQQLLHSGEYRMMIGGHTHYRMAKWFDNMLVVNAGTLRHHHQPCLTLLDVELETVQFFLWQNQNFSADAPLSFANASRSELKNASVPKDDHEKAGLVKWLMRRVDGGSEREGG
jgi:predicted phosphodiesterase